MSKTQPIKDEEMLKKFRNYYRDIEPKPRNYALVVLNKIRKNATFVTIMLHFSLYHIYRQVKKIL